jgi:hypothetical protein
MKDKVINPMIVVEFRAEVCAYINDYNDVTISVADCLGAEESIRVELGSLRALAQRLVHIANAEGV